MTTLLAANRTGGQVRTDFSTFPTPQFARVSRSNDFFAASVNSDVNLPLLHSVVTVFQHQMFLREDISCE